MLSKLRSPLLTLLILLFAFTPLPASAANEDELDESVLWQGLRSGEYIALLRHALAPGTGDPDNFTLDNCRTQRNLNDTGRAQAKRIGERFRQNGIEQAQVYSSQWCRCMDTAALLELGEVQALPALNSFFRRYERRAPQTQALRDWLQQRTTRKPLILVTHQVNITALTGVFPASGELVIIRHPQPADTAIEVVGTVETE